MGYITDIKEIERIAAEREDENWRFRTRLKGSELGCEEIDAIVHELNDRVSAQIDCQTCSNCCRVLNTTLKEQDIERLSAHLSMQPDEFEKEYLREEEGKKMFRVLPCPFLDGNSCSVYEARPEECRSYPHLHKADFVFRTIGVVSNCSCCPIVFHVFEELKYKVRERERRLYDDDFEEE